MINGLKIKTTEVQSKNKSVLCWRGGGGGGGGGEEGVKEHMLMDKEYL